MQTLKKVMNVLGIIATGLLSIFLVVFLVATPVMSAATSFFKTKNIHKVLASVDYTQLLAAQIDTGKLSEIPSIGGDLVEQLMNTEMMEDVIEVCVENVFSVLEGDAIKDGLTAEDIQVIGEEHIEELSGVLQGYLGEDLKLPEKVIKEMTIQILQEYSGFIAEVLPSAEDLGLDEKTIEVVTNLRNGTYFWCVFGAAVLLTVLVVLFQFKRFRGFMWVGIGYGISAIISIVLSVVIRGLDVSHIMGEVTLGTSIVQAMTGLVATEMLKGTVILAVLGIVFILVSVVGKKVLEKKKAAVAA